MVPLVTEAFDWAHGVFLGSIMASETTAAAAGAVGTLRRDPFAMLPFCGYHMGDYFAHWLDVGAAALDQSLLPKIFYVNWFRRGADGKFLWPGYGENSRVLAWIFDRCAGHGGAIETPIGRLPETGALDIEGLDLAPERLERTVGRGPRRLAQRGRAHRRALRPLRRPAARRIARPATRARQAACRRVPDALTPGWERERFERSSDGWANAPPTSARRPPPMAPSPRRRRRNRGSLQLRHVDAGSCNGCELEIASCFSPTYDAERFGIRLEASPRHADGLLVTGPVTHNMADPLRKTYEAVPEPKLVVAVGDCARDCGVFRGAYGVAGAVADVVPVDVEIPGCPPDPEAIIAALRGLSGR